MRVVPAVTAMALLLTSARAFASAAPGPVETLKVDAPETGCPRRRDLVAALEARLPGLLRSSILSASIRRVELVPESASSALLRLHDDRGGIALERRLGEAATGRRDRGDESCQALAEAAALVVVRYLREIGYRPPAASVPDPRPPVPEPPAPALVAVAPVAPPAPALATIPPAPAPPATAVAPVVNAAAAPAPPAGGPAASLGARAGGGSGAVPAPAAGPGWVGLLGVAGGVRAGAGAVAEDARGRGEALVIAHLQRGWFAAELGAGASSETVSAVPGGAAGQLRLRAFPLRVGLAARIRLAPIGLPGALLPGLGLSADLLSFRAVDVGDPRAGTRFDPAAEAGLAYLAAGDRLFLRICALGGLTLAPRDFVVAGADGRDPAAVYRSPAGYLRVQFELGVRLWKNSNPASL